MPLSQLVYASRTSQIGSLEMDIGGLLSAAVRKNATAFVTGSLCFRHDCFLQLLEGSPAAVSQLFISIANDRRHTDVTLLGCHVVVKRQFSEWSMGYAALHGDAMHLL